MISSREGKETQPSFSFEAEWVSEVPKQLLSKMRCEMEIERHMNKRGEKF